MQEGVGSLTQGFRIGIYPAFSALEEPETDFDNAFVGIRVHQNQVEIHYPECYPLPRLLKQAGCCLSEETGSFALSLDSKSPLALQQFVLPFLSSVSLLERKYIESDFKNAFGQKAHRDDPILSMCFLIKDYLAHGIPRQSEVVYQDNRGRTISWRKSVHRTPFITDNGLFFPDLVFADKEQTEPLLTQIYLACVKYSAGLLGWFYGLRAKSIPGEGLDRKKTQSYVFAIKDALGKTFNRIRRERLSHMLTVLSGPLKSKKSSTLSYGTFCYNLVFEAMVDRLLSTFPSAEIETFYPKARWIMKGGESKDTSCLRPDTLHEDSKGNLVVFDSKYYRPESLPQTESVEKQFTYAQHAHEFKKYSKIYSCFILPADFGDDTSFFQVFGRAEAPWLSSSLTKTPEIVPYVVGIYLDLRWLISNYLEKNDSLVIQIVRAIENCSPVN